MKRLLFIASSAMALSACSLAPTHVTPAPLVSATFPTGPAYDPVSSEALRTSWRGLLNDPRLQTLVDRALVDNRNLHQALAQVDAANALYRRQRAAPLPALGAGLTSTFSDGQAGAGGGGGGGGNSHQVSLSLASFEIDLFGRLRSQTTASFETYLASEAGSRAARVSLVAQTASAWLTMAADQDLLRLAEKTRDNAQKSLDVTHALHERQLVARVDVVAAQQVVEQARADVANYTRQVAQDRNALVLLVGGSVSDNLLPPPLIELDATVRAPSAGLTSAVLLDRPDVIQAEHTLRAANADIGVARTALFPTLSLTAAAGLISPSLSSLFDDGEDYWTASPSLSAPLFTPGARANVDYSKAQRDAAVAAYQLTLQIAFQETSDALARAGTIREQRAARDAQAAAAIESLRLGEARYRAGLDAYLTTLTAQRDAYAASQGSLAALLEDLLNRVTLYQVLGGANEDWSGDTSSGAIQ